MRGMVWTGIATVFLGVLNVMAVDEAKYTVTEKQGSCEVRDYAPQILVETVVESSLEEAGNIAFRRLFRYITGNNAASTNIAMTAPVSQEPGGTKIPMTAPVNQRADGGGWAVSFVMPADYTRATLPTPCDPALRVREVPARRMAALRYSGTWSESRYLDHKARLETWIHSRGFTITGEAIWARYNPPFTLWILRRNEVLIPIAR